MASATANLFVKMSLQASDFSRGLKSAQADLRSFGDSVSATGAKIRGMGKNLTLGLTAPIVGFSAFAVNAASDLAEAQSAATVTYGEASNQIIKYSEGAAQAVGLSQQEYLSAATTLGVFGSQAGLVGNDLVGFGNDTIGAAADLASFYNAPVPEVLAAMQSGLSGETEPLRKFGIFVDEASISAYAMANGIGDGTGALTQQEKVLARQGLILDSVGAAQGDFARTSDGLANQQRILTARFKDMSAKIGKFLLPAVLKAVTWLGKMFSRLEKLSPAVLKWAVIIAVAVAALGPLLLILGTLVSAFAPVIAILAFFLSPIGLIIAALLLLAYVFRGPIIAGIKVVVSFLGDLFRYLVLVATGTGTAGEALAKLPGWFQPIARQIGRVVDAISVLVAAFKEDGFGGLIDALPAQLARIGDAFKRIGEIILAAFGNIDWGAVGSALWSGLQAVASMIGSGVLALGSIAVSIGGWLITSVVSLAGKIATWVTDNWDTIKTTAFAIGTALISLAGYVVSSAVSVGSQVYEYIQDNWSTIKANAISLGVVLLSISSFALSAGSATITDWLTNLAASISVSSVLHWATTPIEINPTLNLNLEAAAESATRAALTTEFWVTALKVSAITAAIIAALVLGFIALPIVLPLVLAIKIGPSLITAIVAIFTGVKTAVVEKVGEISWTDLGTAIIDGIESAITAIGSFTVFLVTAGEDLMTGLMNGIDAIWPGIDAWLMNVGQDAFDTVGSLIDTLRQAGVDLLLGLFNGINNQWPDIDTWLLSLPADIVLTVGSLVLTLYQAGVDLLIGMADGAAAGWVTLTADLSAIPWAISSLVGDLGWVLYNAGMSVVQGLIDGVNAMTGPLQGALGAITNLIPDWKGPPSRDAVLLRENGILIMGGLIGGITSELPTLRAMLAGVTGTITNGVGVPTLNAASSIGLEGTPAGDGSGRQPVVNHNYYLTPPEFQKLMRDAEAGAVFADNAGPELGRRRGV